MKQTTSAEIEAFHGSEQKYVTLLFSDGTRIETEDIVEESLEISQTISNGDQLTYGAGSAATVKVGVFATLKHYADLRMTVRVTAGNYTRSFGTFNIKSDAISSDGEYRTLTGYDDLSDILQRDFSDWHNNLSFPMTLKSYRGAFAQEAGVSQVAITLPNDSMIIEQNFVANAYSGKNVLDAICELNACFAIINTDGYLQYIQLATAADGLYPEATLYPANDLYPREWGNPLSGAEYDLGSLHYEEYATDAITGVQIRMTEGDVGGMAGTSANVYVIEDNPLTYGKTTAQLNSLAQALLSRMSGVSFTPAGMTAQASPWYELGDALTVQTKTERITTLIMTKTTTGITALVDSYESQAAKKREKNTNSSSRNIEILKRYVHELTITNEELSSRIEEVNTDLTGQTTALSSRITQTSNAITAEVSRAQAAERAVMANYTGEYTPTASNSPASGWSETAKASHVGDIFLNTANGHYYVWKCDGIKIKFDGRSQTEKSFDFAKILYASGGTYYTTGNLDGGRNGSANTIGGAEIFVPAATAYLYWQTDSSVNDWGFEISSITAATGKPTGFSAGSLPRSVDEVVSGVSNLPKTDHPYANSVAKLWQLNTGLSAPGYRWVDAGTNNSDAVSAKLEITANSLASTVENATKDMSSQITQTESLIETKVSIGDISSKISQEAGLISIISNRIEITSTNFTLDRNGNVTASNAQLNGSLITEYGSKKATLTGGGLTFYYGGSWTGELYAGNGYLSLSANELWINGTQVQNSDSCYVRASNGQVMSIGFETGFFKGYSLSGDTHNIVADLDYYWLNDIVTNLSIDFDNRSASWNWDSAINNLSWNNLS